MALEDQIVRGLLFALMLAAGWWAIAAVRRVANSQSEGARRVKLVFRCLVALSLLTLSFNIAGPVNTLVLAGIIAVVWWIRRGYKKRR